MSNRRLFLAVASIAIGQAVIALLAFLISDQDAPMPLWQSAILHILGTPGAHVSEALQWTIGGLNSMLVGLGFGGLVWGCLIGLILRNRRQRRAGPA